jgi:hypothetical protein
MKLLIISALHSELISKGDRASPGATDNVTNCPTRQARSARSNNLIHLTRAQNYHISRGEAAVPKFPAVVQTSLQQYC